MSKNIYIIKYGVTRDWPEYNWDTMLFATTSAKKAYKIVEIFDKYNEENQANWNTTGKSRIDHEVIEDDLRCEAINKLREVIEYGSYNLLFSEKSRIAPVEVWVEALSVYD